MKKILVVCLVAILSVGFGIFRASADSETKEQNVSQGNYNISIEGYDNPIISSGKVSLKTTLSADADTIIDDGELLSVVIPAEIYHSGDLTKINSDAFTYDHVERVGKNIIVYVKPDPAFNEGSAWSASFTISFQAPIIRDGTQISPEQTFEAHYRGKTAATTLKVVPKEDGTPTLFQKWWKGSFDKDGLALLNTNGSTYNIFHLALNILVNSELNHVVVTDQVPPGLEIDPDAVPTKGIEATDASSVDGVRIIAYGEDGSRKYVTAQYKDAIKVDAATQKITFTREHLEATEMLLIEYKVRVTEALDRYTNTAQLVSDEATRTSTVNMRLDDDGNFNKVLRKSVDEVLINETDEDLEYTLELNAITGTIQAGQVIMDELDERLQFVSVSDDQAGLFEVTEQNNQVKITTKRDIPIGQSGKVTFIVNPLGVEIGGIVKNTAQMVLNNVGYHSNTVSTTKYSGKLIVTKQDSENSEIKISNTEFEVQDAQGNVVKTGVTDKNGELIITGLAPGPYKLVETRAARGYKFSGIVVDFTIRADSMEPVYLVVENDPIPASAITLVKVDEETGAGLAGAVFELTAEENNASVQGTTDKAGELTFDKLLPGKYILKEVIAPTGYILDETEYPIEISEMGGEQVSLEVTNKREQREIPVIEKPDPVTEVPNPVTEVPNPIVVKPQPAESHTPNPAKPQLPAKIERQVVQNRAELPKTGDQGSPMGILLAGLGMCLAGVVLIRRR